MKRNLLLGLIAISMPMVWAGCGDKDEDEFARREESRGAEPRHKLAMKYSPGAWKTVQTMDQTVGVGDRTQKSEMTMHMLTRVSQPGPDGTKTATMRFTRMVAKQPGLHMDSDRIAPNNGGRNPAERAMASVMTALLGAEIQMRVSAKNEITEVKGLSAMWDRMAAGMGPTERQLLNAMKEGLNDDTMRRLADMSYMLPDEPVGKGAIWHGDLDLPIPIVGAMEMQLEMELLRFEEDGGRKTAVIAVTGRASSDEPTTTDMGGGKVRVTRMRLDQTGTMRFDVEQGMVTRQQVKQTGQIDMEATRGGETKEQTVELDQTITTAVTPAEE